MVFGKKSIIFSMYSQRSWHKTRAELLYQPRFVCSEVRYSVSLFVRIRFKCTINQRSRFSKFQPIVLHRTYYANFFWKKIDRKIRISEFLWKSVYAARDTLKMSRFGITKLGLGSCSQLFLSGRNQIRVIMENFKIGLMEKIRFSKNHKLTREY